MRDVPGREPPCNASPARVHWYRAELGASRGYARAKAGRPGLCYTAAEHLYDARPYLQKELVDEADREAFLEQERHLLYVACTRARERERLVVTYSGTPSRWVVAPGG